MQMEAEHPGPDGAGRGVCVGGCLQQRGTPQRLPSFALAGPTLIVTMSAGNSKEQN